MSGFLESAPNILLLVFGFGFVIFWHELGHFLAAKWAGVKVEQFAVGFGQALISWRKGLGFRIGSSAKEFESRVQRYVDEHHASGREGAPTATAVTSQQFVSDVTPFNLSGAKKNKTSIEESSSTSETRRSSAGSSGDSYSSGSSEYQSSSGAAELRAAATALGISETEYRLNWMPLGGYVKMLGQDDMHANAEQSDPRAYNMKPISQRMVIISAGVIMNVILAAVGFFVLFRFPGLDVPPPVVGAVMPLSPAQQAGIRVGDRILEFDGRPQRDFTKIQLNVALVKEGEAVPVKVQHPDGQVETLTITPAHPVPDSTGFLALGITPSEELQGVETKKQVVADFNESKPLGMPDEFAVQPGEKIVAVNGQPVSRTEYYKLYDAVQAAAGNPVTITVSDNSGKHDEQITPQFVEPFSGPLNFAGLVPRAMVLGFTPESKAHGPLQVGDAIESVTVKGDTLLHPTRQAMIDMVTKPGVEPNAVDLTVLRSGNAVINKDVPTIDLDNPGLIARLLIKFGLKTERRGLGVQLDHDANSAVIGSIIPDSAADRAGITITNSGDVTVTRIGDQPVKSFRDIKRLIAAAKPGKINFTVKTDASEKTVPVELSQDDITTAANETYRVDLLLHELSEPRKTTSFTTAARWGVEETRDLIVQFYITLQRMIIGHSVPAKNMMGPLGIVTTGAAFANRGIDNLIWFLAMISANLAVVNFLPIPIVDGGLFVFLLIEKFQGKPISPRVQSIAQLVGIALILSVFIFVTIQDIHRL